MPTMLPHITGHWSCDPCLMPEVNYRSKSTLSQDQLIFLVTREKEKNFDIKIVIFRALLDLLWFFKVNRHKITKLKVWVKLF